MRSLRLQKQVFVGLLRQRLPLLVLTLLLIGGLSYEAQAQAVYGSISGTISDPQGASIPNATVTASTEESVTGPTMASSPAPSRLERLEEEVQQLKEELKNIKARLPPQ